MRGLSRNIDSLYFEYAPVIEHREDCPRRGTGLWEVTRYAYVLFGDVRETVLRLACHECHVVAFQDHEGDAPRFEVASSGQVGYGSPPEKVTGVWLHAGPPVWDNDERGPVAFLITRTKDRPRRPADVLGRIAWNLGPRGGLRWSAGAGCTDHGTVLVAAGQTWASRRAAVAWVIEHSQGEQ